MYAITIPENTFESGSVSAIPCVLKIQTQYAFSQRRLDIGSLVGGLVDLRLKDEWDAKKGEYMRRLKKTASADFFDEISETELTDK